MQAGYRPYNLGSATPAAPGAVVGGGAYFMRRRRMTDLMRIGLILALMFL